MSTLESPRSTGSSLATPASLDLPEVRLIESLDDRHARFIANCPAGNAFHTANWAAVLQQTYAFRPCHLSAQRSGRVVAVLPLMEVDTLFGKKGVSLPFTDECEILGDAPCAAHLVREAVQLGKERRWQSVEFRASRELGETLGCAQPSLEFYGHRLELAPDPEAIFRRTDSATRRAVRKAMNAGVSIEFSTSVQSVREYYRLHCSTRRKHGVPPQSFGFFHNIHRHILSQNLGTVVSALFHGKTIASAIFFTDARNVLYKFGASDVAFQSVRANNLIMWSAIEHFASSGKQLLDMGRTAMNNEGLRRFKLGWGATERRVAYYLYNLRKNECVPRTEETSSALTSFFRWMPAPLARLAGAILYKYAA